MEQNTNSQSITEPSAAASLAPVSSGERIQALDVVRGFALIGIFLMNIEFFNRTTMGIGLGMPLGLTGADWWASWFVAYFVQGKFWTIFSLLFGMGFAVMLTRAERAGRPFLTPYLRRIGALAVFGAVHYIFLWEGDILFSYSVAAGALLILLYGKWKPMVLAFLVMLGLSFVPNMGPVGGIAFGLVFVGLNALYLRSEKRIKGIPLFSFILMVLGTIGLIAAAVLWALPNGPKEPRIPATIMGSIFMIFGLLSAKYYLPVEKRVPRMAIALYSFGALTMTIFGLVQYLTPPEPEVPVTKPAVVAKADDKTTAKVTEPVAPAKAAEKVEAKADDSKAADAPAAKVADKADAKAPAKPGDAPKTEKKEPEKTEAQKAAENKAQRAKRLADRLEENRQEEKILSSGTYLETVELRARKFLNKAAGDAGFATILIAMFLLGNWFVRSGVMENTEAHLPFFRKLAMYALPFGIGLGLLGSMIAMSHVPGNDHDGFQFARGLAMIGNLPACLGYVGLVVVMLHSKTVFANIRVLSAPGRMALTTYLTQSVICSYIFFGYGLAHWGMSRATQVLFVAVVFSIQIVFSHWWLARFRYGPMEWVWRALTYRTMPAMRN